MKTITTAIALTIALGSSACKKEDAQQISGTTAAVSEVNTKSPPVAAKPVQETVAAPLSVDLNTTLASSCEDVWKVVGDFSKINQFVSIIAKVETTGHEAGSGRTCTLQDGSILKERLDELDKQSMTLSYSILESPLPLEGYKSTISLVADGDKACNMNWKASFRAKGAPDDKVTALVAGFYQDGFTKLAEGFGNVE